MAPSPEYDKEPKAPDKSVTDISNEDTKLLQNITNDQIINSDHKTTNSSVNSDVENNKHVETLDDEKLRALLDEAITYKCPKDREGKSSLFKELLEEVEQDEQACEAAARGGSGAAGRRGLAGRGGRGRRALQHSNSLQDLVAALAAEPATTSRKHHRHHHASSHAPAVSARAIHGGSLPSGVDTSSLLSEEGCRGVGVGGGGGYLATVRCVNPPPLAERRVSASDANAPSELDMLNRRSKPMFPMTYTARATLEIGSGAVCSGRAVTTTTASNQVRTTSPTALHTPPPTTHRPRGPPRASASAFTAAVHRWYDTLHAPLASDQHTPRQPHRPRGDYDDDHSTHTTAPDKYRQYKKRVGDIRVPTRVDINPRNVRSMSIGEPGSSIYNVDSWKRERNSSVGDTVSCEPDLRPESPDVKTVSKRDNKNNDVYIDMEDETVMKDQTMTESNFGETISDPKSGDIIELEDIISDRPKNNDTISFSDFVAGQEKLLHDLESIGTNVGNVEYPKTVIENNNNDIELHDMTRKGMESVVGEEVVDMSGGAESGESVSNEVVVQLNTKQDDKASGDRYILAELPNNAYVFLTLPKRLLTPLNTDDKSSVEVHEIENDNNVKPLPEKSKRKKEKAPVGNSVSVKKKDAINKNALRVLLFENLLKSDRGEMSNTGEPRSAIAAKEVDSGIPFSCITTPEVVTSCNTTSSTSQSAVALDPKPLQLCSEYRAVASVTGAPAHLAAAPPAPLTATPHEQRELQPRSVIASSFNGLPLSRPNYGSTATTANDEYKKSIDENGNSVQGYTSPLSGSSQHKKPRRKKSSKNETVIDCRQLDGYQGDKDVNELIRFIESSEQERAPKLRAKHKDDADDKTAKKRSAERRKDKEKVKRASSLEELSRTKLEDLTAARPALTPAKPERRSWGDAAPPPPPQAAPAPPPPPQAAPAPPPPPEPPAPLEQADFQTVTKKRKPRRRTDEPAPRRRPPSPRARQDSAPPSDRSNDSNDDMDSVHSLPEPRPAAPPATPPAPPAQPAPPPHASYADIARTRHNIPDLIESCNFYAEGEGGPPPPPPADADPYPALEARGGEAAGAARRPREPKPPAATARRERKERAVSTPAASAAGGECPAPDVVGAGGRPAVILVDGAARVGARDMDGVTFGFDINEQLVGGGARRARCDLLRHAPEAVAVRAGGCAALRYLPPPDPPRHTHAHLHHLVDYVGTAWEEVVRCGSGGSGKVRYYAE